MTGEIRNISIVLFGDEIKITIDFVPSTDGDYAIQIISSSGTSIDYTPCYVCNWSTYKGGQQYQLVSNSDWSWWDTSDLGNFFDIALHKSTYWGTSSEIVDTKRRVFTEQELSTIKAGQGTCTVYSLTLTSDKSIVVEGEPVTLSGKLTCDNVGIAGTVVSFYETVRLNEYQGNAVTDNNGDYTFTWYPTASAIDAKQVTLVAGYNCTNVALWTSCTAKSREITIQTLPAGSELVYWLIIGGVVVGAVYFFKDEISGGIKWVIDGIGLTGKVIGAGADIVSGTVVEKQVSGIKKGLMK